MRHVNGITSREINFRSPPPSKTNASCIPMNENKAPRAKGQHLNDIEIAKVLGLDKAGKSQREIARLMHCTQKLVQNTLINYDFDMFQGRNTRREYKRKITKREDRYIEHALK